MNKNKKLQIAGILLLFPTIISVILGPATVNSYYSFSMVLGLIFIISLFTTLPIGIVLIVRGRKEKIKEIKIKGIKEKIQLWKDEGYNVDELEQMIEFVGIDKSEIEVEKKAFKNHKIQQEKIKPIEKMEFAGYGKRFGSFFIDGIIMTIINFAVSFFIGFLWGITTGEIEPSGAVWVFLAFVIMIIHASYFIHYFSKGQTPGMKAMKIRLCTTDGKRQIGYDKSFLRWLGLTGFGTLFLSNFISPEWLIIYFIVIFFVYLSILIDKKNQGLHDKIAGTYVIYTGGRGYSPDRICPNCTRGIPFDANICPYCGKKFEV